MSEFVVGEIVQYRDWGWVTTPSGHDEYSVIWRDVEIVKVCKIRVKIKHADGRLMYADMKNLRKALPMLESAPKPPAPCTCQICGRVIKATTGLIAHHGYQRPGHGWQTSSCSGARHKPYEVSCDAIAPAIENVTAYIAREEAFLVEFAANPPASLSYSRGETYRKSERINVDRPADFTPDGRHRTYRPGAYDTLYFAQKYRIETEVKHARNDLAYLENRLANWKAPAEVVES